MATELTNEDLKIKIATLESQIDALLEKTEMQAATQPEPQQTPQPEPQPQTMYSEGGRSRTEKLEEYEKEYLERLAKQLKEEVELQRAAEELVAQRKAEAQTAQVSSNRGSMPKGWNS